MARKPALLSLRSTRTDRTAPTSIWVNRFLGKATTTMIASIISEENQDAAVPKSLADDAASRTPAQPATGDNQLFDSYSKTIAAVANRVAPSVVNIRVTSERGHGGGSGFIIARDGFILTNSHVVLGARELEVTLHDARVYPAQLIGTDAETDLA